MQVSNDVPDQNYGSGPLKKWLTKKQVMRFLDIGRTTYAKYKEMGLKISKVRNREMVHEDHLDEFLRGFIR